MRDKEKRKAYNKKYREANKDYAKKYYEANRDKMRDYAKKYYESNRDKLSEIQRKYYKEKTGRLEPESEERREERKLQSIYKRKERNRKFVAKYQKTNKELICNKQKRYQKNTVSELSNVYVIAKLKSKGFTTEQIEQYPELIETQKIILKTKRLCKTLQNSEKAL